jgi:tetratricopeptide (TPR) repeat protein
MRTTIRIIRSAAGRAAAIAAALLCAANAHAVPHLPDRDDTVLEHLSPAVVALREFRGARAMPATSTLADALANARRYVELGQTYSDPRAYGYAQAALGGWWTANPAPPQVLVMRARILQFRHEFDAALVQLEAALKSDQFDADAWLLFANIQQVRGNVRAARAACLKLIPIADPLIGATCAASTAALNGRSLQGEQLLAKTLMEPTGATASERAWAWTTLAEARARIGEAAAAEAAFKQALILAPGDIYARAAYADLLLDQDRARDVRALLGEDAVQADATLLRLTIAAQRNADADAATLRETFSQRFAEARARGDRTHQREQARFALEVQRDPSRALDLARSNFAVQREPADTRILLECAIAAGNALAAQPALDWLRDTGVEAPQLLALAQQIRPAQRGENP